jgi:glycosyltransferase involved in cell wall biosynthesis
MPVFLELSECCRLSVFYSPVKKYLGYGTLNEGFDNINFAEVPTIRPLGDFLGMYQLGILSKIVKNKPQKVILFANLRYSSFWAILLVCKVFGIDVYPHGHGLLHKKTPSIFWRFLYKIILKLCTKYICYSQSVMNSLSDLGFSKKLVVAENSISNNFLVFPEQKSKDAIDILFLGRVRRGCGLDLLFLALEKLNSNRTHHIRLHVIGDGSELEGYKKRFGFDLNIIFYGSLYDHEAIAEISRNCMFGCYPGNSGLSIIHYMSLSLPMVIHNNFALHEGPEPTFVNDGVEGIFFDKDNFLDLTKKLEYMYQNIEHVNTMQYNAFKKYKFLTTPSLAQRIIQAIN